MGRRRVQPMGRSVAATLVGAGLAVALGSPIGALPTPSGGPSCPAVGLVNGGFEEPSIVGLQHPHDDDVPGWQKGTSDPLFEVWTNATGKEPYEGRQFIEINVSAADSLFQQVELPVAGEVALGFAHRGRDGTYSMRARLRQGGVDVATIDATSPATGPDRNGWSRHQATVVVEAGPAELWMESVTGAGLGNLLDGVSLRYASCVAAVRTVTVGGSPAATARMGADLVHTVVVSNVGEGPAETIVLVDGPPAGTTLVPGTLAVDGAPVGQFAATAAASPSAALALDLGTLAPGEDATVTFTARVTSRPAGDAFTGDASVTFDDPTFGGGSARSNAVSIAFERTDTNGDGLFDDEQWGGGLEPRDSDGDGVADYAQVAGTAVEPTDVTAPPAELPRTGTSTRTLAFVGSALAAVGVVLRLVGRGGDGRATAGLRSPAGSRRR